MKLHHVIFGQLEWSLAVGIISVVMGVEHLEPFFECSIELTRFLFGMSIVLCVTETMAMVSNKFIYGFILASICSVMPLFFPREFFLEGGHLNYVGGHIAGVAVAAHARYAEYLIVEHKLLLNDSFVAGLSRIYLPSYFVLIKSKKSRG